MQMTMRWFGPEEDKISLEHIRQVPGVEGVVGALYDVAVGEVWPVDKIERLVGQAHAAGLKMEVIESVNIHDDIKIGLPTRDRYIANYQQTIRNLARFCGEVIVSACVDHCREKHAKPYGTRLWAGQAVSARLVGK